MKKNRKANKCKIKIHQNYSKREKKRENKSMNYQIQNANHKVKNCYDRNAYVNL